MQIMNVARAQTKKADSIIGLFQGGLFVVVGLLGKGSPISLFQIAKACKSAVPLVFELATFAVSRAGRLYTL